MKKLMLVGVVLLASLSPLLSSASETPPDQNKHLSVEEFLVQRDVMVKDLSSKIDVLQEALNCAKAAKTPEAFTECNEVLRKNIVAAMQPK